MASMQKMQKAYEILKEYKGTNPYFFVLKKKTLLNREILTDFQIDYIIDNLNYKIKEVNKVIDITDWYGESKKEEWNCEFIPKKLKIYNIIAETKQFYHCYVQYRKSVEPFLLFLPKRAVLKNFLVEDYTNLSIDFDKYNSLMHKKDPNRFIKPHQEDGVKFLVSRKKCILADSMGTGKSATLSLASIEGNYEHVLIICPASLKTNWKEELEWFIPSENITIVEGYLGKTKTELEQYLGYEVGTSNKKVKELQEEAKLKGKWKDNKYIIVNYDILDEFYKPSRSYSEDALKKLSETYPLFNFLYNKKCCIIVDEAHRLSNNTSNQYKVVSDLIRKTNPNSIFLATGTPVTNNPLNLYYLLKLIENDITSDYDYYINRYCGAKTFFNKADREKWTNIFLGKKNKKDWYSLTVYEKQELNKYLENHCRKIKTATGADNLEELKDRISHIYLRRTKEDVGNLPEKTIHEVAYTLTSVQQKEYDKLWEEYEKEKLEENPDKEINKDLLEGAVYRKYCSNNMVPNTIKLVDQFIKNGEKVVVACCYDEELYTLRDHYKDKCVIYNGKMSLKEKDEAIRKFRNDKDISVFIGNIVAAGVGITLTVSTKLIFNNLSYLASDNLQYMDRIHRIGQTKPCDIYVQYFKNTQYEHIWDISLRKEMIQNSIIKKENEK